MMTDISSRIQEVLAASAARLFGEPLLLVLVAAIGAAVVVLVRMWRQRQNALAAEGRRRRVVLDDGTGGVFGSLTGALASQMPESQKESSDFARLLRQAGLYSRSSRASIYALRFVLLFVPLTAAGTLAVLAPEGRTFPILICGAVLAAGLSIMPRFYVLLRRNRRMLDIRHGLADMMDMLSMCMDGGMPLSPSLDHVARNLNNYPALAEELQIVKRQAEVGSLRRALRDLADRVDLPEVRQVTSLLARGEQLGTRLSVSLLDQADHLRNVRRQMATMHANRTPVILTLPLMFCFAPAVLILLMSPAMLELSNFFNPAEGPGILDGNESLGAAQIVRTLDELP